LNESRLDAIFEDRSNEHYLELAESRKDKFYSMIPKLFPSLIEE
jgi:hypothetical protein